MNTILINNTVSKKGDYFVAQCLNIKASSFGDTKEDALFNLKKVLESYFENNEHPEFTFTEEAE